MIHLGHFRLDRSLSWQPSCPAHPSRFPALAYVMAASTPLAMLPLLATACQTAGSQPADIQEEASPSIVEHYDPEEPSEPPPPATCPGEGCSGIETCPVGFSRVGPPGALGSFCVQQQQEPEAAYLQAMTECFTMVTSTGAVPHLCTPEEWYLACSQGADVGEEPIVDMTNGWEWAADSFTAVKAILLGNGACSKIGAGKLGTNRAFRCCVS